MKKSHLVLRCAAVVFVLGMAPTVALAYIDPGNGAYMVQALFTLVGASLFYLRHPIRTLKAFFHWAANRWRLALGTSPRQAEPAAEIDREDTVSSVGTGPGAVQERQ